MEPTQYRIVLRSGLLPAAGLAFALALSGCGSGAPAAAPASASPPPSSSSAPSATEPTATMSAETKTFAFTTQKLSLRYPGVWTAESRTSPRGPIPGEFVTFKDAKGRT